MSPRPGNRRRRLALAAAQTLLAGAVLGSPTAAQQARSEARNALHDRCVGFAHEHPKEGLERARLWREQGGGGFWADHCIATAMFDLRDYAGAAKHFEALATAMMTTPAQQRAVTLAQAGQSWLAGGDFARAKADFDAALTLNGEDADLLIDRAETYAAMQQYWEAIDDLNRCIELVPKRAEAYIYRASAYRLVEAIDLATDDVERGLALAPDNILGLLERGNIRRLKGDVAGARKDWLRVTQLAPNSPPGKAAKANLGKLTGKDKAAEPADAARKKPQ